MIKTANMNFRKRGFSVNIKIRRAFFLIKTSGSVPRGPRQIVMRKSRQLTVARSVLTPLMN